jgi:sterol 3beta-glucosyltransferase
MAGREGAFWRSVAQVARESARDQWETLIGLCSGADAVISGFLTEEYATCLGEALQRPVVLMHTFPVRRTRAFAHCLLTTRRLPARLNLLSGAAFDYLWWRYAGESVNECRSFLGLPPTRQPASLRSRRMRLLELQAYSSALVPRIGDYGPHRPVIGALSTHYNAQQDDHRQLDTWLARGEPPVFVGFGSMPILSPLLDTIRRTLTRLDLRALVAAGWSETTISDGGDDRLLIVGDVDHGWVMPKCKYAVHHGGAGTTISSLSAGLPTLVVSVLADQPFWASRLVRLGVGLQIPLRQFDERRFTTALKELGGNDVALRVRALRSRLEERSETADRAASLAEAAVETFQPRAGAGR